MFCCLMEMLNAALLDLGGEELNSLFLVAIAIEFHESHLSNFLVPLTSNRPRKSPCIDKQRMAVSDKISAPEVCVQVSERKEHHTALLSNVMEAAEKRVVEAVRDEVDIFFKDRDRPQIRHVSTDCQYGSKRSRKQPQVTNISDGKKSSFGWGFDQLSKRQ